MLLFSLFYQHHTKQFIFCFIRIVCLCIESLKKIQSLCQQIENVKFLTLCSALSNFSHAFPCTLKIQLIPVKPWAFEVFGDPSRLCTSTYSQSYIVPSLQLIIGIEILVWSQFYALKIHYFQAKHRIFHQVSFSMPILIVVFLHWHRICLVVHISMPVYKYIRNANIQLDIHLA